MGMADYSHGFREGVMIRGAGMFDAGFGRVWYVDAKTGADGNSGKRRDRPFLTMSKALAQLDSGDTILFRGKVREQLETPAGVFDVTIIGAANRPRHADDHTEENGARGSSAALWTLPASAVADTPLLRVNQQGWRFANFLMAATTSQVCLDMYRNADESPASDERDASHFDVVDMRFAAAGIHIRFNGGPNFGTIRESMFQGATTAIANTTGSGAGTNGYTRILNSYFVENTNHVVVPLNKSLVKGCTFGLFTTKALDLTNGIGTNQVVGNFMSGDYDGGYVAASGDNWIGNIAFDVASGETEADGATNSLPVA